MATYQDPRTVIDQLAANTNVDADEWVRMLSRVFQIPGSLMGTSYSPTTYASTTSFEPPNQAECRLAYIGREQWLEIRCPCGTRLYSRKYDGGIYHLLCKQCGGAYHVRRREAVFQATDSDRNPMMVHRILPSR